MLTLADMKRFSRESGYILIELLSVVTITGVLAANVVPRVVSVEGQAHAAQMKSLASSLDTMVTFVNGVALSQGKLDSHQLVLNGETVALKAGFPVASWEKGIAPLLSLTESFAVTTLNSRCSQSLYCVADAAATPNQSNERRTLHIWPNGYTLNDRCYTFYRSAEVGQRSEVGHETAGC